ncbi:hypothetical protein Bbelb_250170 [Branchiostoma belcheri]|nr:hypothetical protein Bbelb_250170 [Branchiostoma belcheri]
MAAISCDRDTAREQAAKTGRRILPSIALPGRQAALIPPSPCQTGPNRPGSIRQSVSRGTVTGSDGYKPPARDLRVRASSRDQADTAAGHKIGGMSGLDPGPPGTESSTLPLRHTTPKWPPEHYRTLHIHGREQSRLWLAGVRRCWLLFGCVSCGRVPVRHSLASAEQHAPQGSSTYKWMASGAGCFLPVAPKYVDQCRNLSPSALAGPSSSGKTPPPFKILATGMYRYTCTE